MTQAQEFSPTTIRSLALLGYFEEGWEQYQNNLAPTPEDRRWAGECVLNLGRYTEARDLLHQAIALGATAAHIQLASCLRLLGHLPLTEQTLSQIHESVNLDPLDRTMLEREWGAIYLAQGLLSRSKNAFERAWGLSFVPGAETLQSGIANALGFVFFELGQDRQALEMLERAMQKANPARQLRIRQVRALSLLYLGRYLEAETELKKVITGFQGTSSAAQMAMFCYSYGLLERAQGSMVLAYHQFVYSIEHAQALGEEETLCYAELEAAAVQIVLGQDVQARVHLARARRVALSTRLEALLKLREGMFAAQFGSLDGVDALNLLCQALEVFETLELSREQAWVKLHMVDVLLSQAQHHEAEILLAQVADLRYVVGGGGFLALELRGLPRVIEHLESLTAAQYSYVLLEDWRRVSPHSIRHVRLQTLGKSHIWLDGQELTFDLSRCLEFACYFLLHPSFTLKEMLLELFPDEDPRRARNYFHQVRYELERVIPGFQVKYATGQYTLANQHLRISWDYPTVLQGLKSDDLEICKVAITAYAGLFLPHSEADWVQTQREDLTWLVSSAGLRVLQDQFALEQFSDCLTLASQLLEYDPYNESLNEMLARATSKLEGDLAARHTLVRLCQHFQRDLGVIPERLLRLRDQVMKLN
jgi:DNA-binding SARP family transcriptional activator